MMFFALPLLESLFIIFYAGDDPCSETGTAPRSVERPRCDPAGDVSSTAAAPAGLSSPPPMYLTTAGIAPREKHLAVVELPVVIHFSAPSYGLRSTIVNKSGLGMFTLCYEALSRLRATSAVRMSSARQGCLGLFGIVNCRCCVLARTKAAFSFIYHPYKHGDIGGLRGSAWFGKQGIKEGTRAYRCVSSFVCWKFD